MSAFSGGLRRTAPPGVGLNISTRYVSAISLGIDTRGPVVTQHAVEVLPAGALAPSLAERNVHDEQAVTAAIARVLQQVGSPRRVGLLLPDSVAKVSLMQFDRVPERRSELDQLIRWQMRKAMPFPVEDAQIGWTAAGSGREFVVAAAKKDVVQEYERLCLSAGAHPGLVDLSTFNLVNAVLAGRTPPASDWLVVNVADDYVSIGVLRGSQLLFFRTRGSDDGETVADLAHQTAMYHQDRLDGQGLDRVVLAVQRERDGDAGTDVKALQNDLSERLSRPVELADANGVAFDARPADRSPAAIHAVLPLVGLLLRERDAA